MPRSPATVIEAHTPGHRLMASPSRPTDLEPPRFADEIAFTEPSEHDRRILYRQLLLVAAGALALLAWSSDVERGYNYYLGLTICLVAMVPILTWARKMEHNYPFFEIFIATNITSYGVPLIMESESLRLFDESSRSDAAHAVMLFMVCALAAYYAARTESGRKPFWREPAFRRLGYGWLTGGVVLTTLYTLIVPFFWVPESGVANILRAVMFGVGMTSTFIIAIAWGQKLLVPSVKTMVAVCLALQFLLQSASLVLRAGTSVVLLGFVGYFFGARRIPYLPLTLALIVMAVLNHGKYDMRDRYWEENIQHTPELVELPSFYGEWIEAGLHPKVRAEVHSSSLLLERNSLLHILCLVMHQSPAFKAFLDGETYLQIPGQFVPRLFWPEKPRGHISTYTLGIYYGLQDEESTYTTTIAFGLVPEAYANYGLWGVAGLGLVAGFAFKKIVGWSRRSPVFSFAGLLLILLTAWSFQTELPLSAWLSSLFQGAISILAFSFVFRRVQETVG
ncbi:MAG: hypothetical protein A3G75_02400 [Verrucomicrobia bacterium RIFCSPLOWO2_12_FULL_64_8]|nr:MAG: hypothetical protein A3G75_02400 [Verrucomicrobia bacterium RIFCSPLOWO2_12_FULL_64_8]